VSLLIDTAIAADSIVKAAWARAEANRERLRLRQDLQTTREATDRRLRRRPGWEDAFTNPLITNYRPDEPIAVPRRETGPTAVRIGGVFSGVRQFQDGDSAYYLHAWSGDGLATAVATIDVLPGATNGFEGQFVIFPVDSTSCVLLWLGLSKDETLLNIYNNQAAFFVGQSAVRQIAVPSWIANRQSGVVGLTDGWISYGSAHWAVVDEFRSPIVVTPQIYELYTRVADELVYFSAPSYAAIRAAAELIVPGLKPIAFRVNTVDESVAVAESFGYEWSGADPVLTNPFSGVILRLNPPVPFDQPEWKLIQVSPPPSAPYPVETPSSPVANHQFFWDWGRPDYCRERLLAFGFQPEDLEP